ncbi:hypothetical protein [Streptomyces lancefieldiae]|uniref:Secreted protein n=1 Tax=Streptomyces lancefieldiae TaxID=3075520 RepID=A0ABU3AR76_9ACTN|nr:hypothetical protein [Streptomyces sp. DSM 40712]MDT0612681.1 hypothetical protein [Streptomyces sp. DSM 40712]
MHTAHSTRSRKARALMVTAVAGALLGGAIALPSTSPLGGEAAGGERDTVVNAGAAQSDTASADSAADRAAAVGSTKSDCPFSVENPFVQNGRLYARTTITCKERHTISLTLMLRRPQWPFGTKYIAVGKVRLNDWKGTKSLTTSISCNEVSPRTDYSADAVLYDKRFVDYPVEVDDQDSPGTSKGC